MTMKILTTEGWDDYRLLDSGDGMRLEKFGNYTISRPDPQALWTPSLTANRWAKVEATFSKFSSEKRGWDFKQTLPDKWVLKYKNLSFYSKLTPFKHTGIFPEQSVLWDWSFDLIKKANRPVRLLNLFGYTGIASISALSAGAEVTHVDSSKPATSWANENLQLSNLKPGIRWIVDDVLKFTAREVRRGSKYDALIMDPPVYGHGPSGEVWDFNKNFPELVQNCRKILSDLPLFIIINAYAVSASSITLRNILDDMTRSFTGKAESGELVIKEYSERGRELSTGIYGRWSSIK